MNNVLESAKQSLDWVVAWSAHIAVAIGISLPNSIDFAEVYTLLIRWVFPILAVAIFLRGILPLLREGEYDRVWGYLEIPDSDRIRIPLKHWESSIGRSKLSDIVINLPFVSRSHAVLTFRERAWSITDLGSKGGVKVNGEKIEQSRTLEEGDIISIAGADFRLLSADEEVDDRSPYDHWSGLSRLGRNVTPGKTLLLVLLFQLLGGIQIYFSMGQEATLTVLLTFLLFVLAECFCYIIMMRCSKKYFELELLAFFLCGLNLLVVAAAVPEQLNKQLIAIILGILVFYALQMLLRDLGRARKLKYVVMAGALVLLVLNLTIGETRFGARNWINLGFITFQPMEFVKVAFVLAGTATLDKLLTTRNITAFIGFTGICIGALILMRDLGTAVVFFVAFLVIAFMRSGDLRTIAFISSGAILGALAVVSFMPYIASRFQAWGHVWEYANTIGYQQTRTMIAAASGGLLGVGGGNGFLLSVPAADTDLVFGLLCEEWGILVALTAVLIVVFFAIFAVSLMRGCKSSFYAIAASGAAAIFLIQTALNVFGSVDFLPLTGITLPFVSNGGSSMIASWALLAFIKAADERRRPDSEEMGD